MRVGSKHIIRHSVLPHGVGAFMAGAAAVLTLPPFSILALGPAAYGALFLLVRDRIPLVAGAIGWLFGLGYFGFGLSWIAESFQIEAERFWFFTLLLDPRDPPEGMRRGARLLCGIVVIVSNILLGSLMTLKEVVVYGATDPGAGFTPLTDETIRGYTIWVPTSMIMIVAIVLVVNGWNRAEERRWNARHTLMQQSNSAALEFPETAQELRLKVTRPNRDLGRTLAVAALSMFVVVMATAITVVSLG